MRTQGQSIELIIEILKTERIKLLSDNLSKEENKMSRIGRLPVVVPAGVTVEITEDNHVTVKGPKGTLEKFLPVEMGIKLKMVM